VYYPLVNLILSSFLVSANFVNSAQFLIYESPRHLESSKVNIKNLDNPKLTFIDELKNQYLIKNKLSSNNITTAQKLKIKKDFDLETVSGIVVDIKTKDILFNKEADKQVPIASITKLMTALVFLDAELDLDAIYTMRRQDRREGGRIYLYMGEQVKIKDLLYLSLTASANTGTIALVSSTGFSQDEFVARMNKKAQELGLKNTFFYDPTGLDDFNVSTAREIAKLASIAFSNKLISDAVLNDVYEFQTLAGRTVTSYSTNALLHSPTNNKIKILGGKTGHIDSAGYCFVAKFKDKQGHDIISVVLGAEDMSGRFSQTMNMIEWVYESYEWR